MANHQFGLPAPVVRLADQVVRLPGCDSTGEIAMRRCGVQVEQPAEHLADLRAAELRPIQPVLRVAGSAACL